MDDLLLVPPAILKLAGHPIRWSMLTRLARSDYRAQEFVTLFRLPQNLVSYHLRQLRLGQLVSERKSSADERSLYYSLNLEQFRTLYFQAGEQLHPALSDVSVDPASRKQPDQVPPTPVRVLFLCTENSARSQIAQALLEHLSRGTIESSSAGSTPAAQIHPLAALIIAQLGIDVNQMHPKHLDTFRGQHFDAIVTVCDRVREACPTFPDDPEQIHWSIADPALEEGSETRSRAFEQTSLQLTTRIRLLITVLERKRRQRSKEK